MTQSVFDRLAERPLARESYTFAFNPNDTRRLADAVRAADVADMNADAHPASKTAKADALKAHRAVDKVRGEIVTVTVSLQEIGVDATELLRHDHPPTDQQIADADVQLEPGQRLAYNPETFPPALFAASVVDVTFSDRPDDHSGVPTPTEAAKLYARLSELDRVQVLALVTMLNGQSSRVDQSGKG